MANTQKFAEHRGCKVVGEIDPTNEPDHHKLEVRFHYETAFHVQLNVLKVKAVEPRDWTRDESSLVQKLL